MSPSKVYIQIPHFNNAPYIEDCIRSVNELTYPNLDIHFYDDHSSDNTQDIINKFSETKINFHNNIERLGRVKNYQKAFSYHRDADWFINLDSDDYYTSSNWITDAMTIVESNSSDNIVHIQSNFLTPEIIKKLNPVKSYSDGYYLISGIDYLELCIKYYSFSHLGSIFNLAKVSETGAYIDDCMHTDFFTAMRVAVRGNVMVGDKQVGIWRKHNGNQSKMRYSEEEYQKNELAYYRFFEFCEDYISYKKLKNLIKIFEHREAEKKISLGLKSDGIIHELKKSIIEKTFSFSIFILFIKHYFQISKDSSSFLSAALVNISSGIMTRVLSLLVVFISLPIIVKHLGLASFGWIGLYTNIVSAIYILDFGFTNIVTKEIAQSEKKSLDLKQKLSTLESIYFIIGFIILGSLYFSAPYISQYFFKENQFSFDDRISILKWISVAVFFQWPHSFYSGALYGFGRQILANNCQLILTLIKYIGAIMILCFVSTEVKIFLYWQIGISILTICVFKFFIYREEKIWLPFFHFSSKYISQIKKLAFGISLISIFSFVYTDFVNIILVRWLSFINYSYYTILLTIVTAMITYSATVKNALFPSIAQLVSRNNLKIEFQSYLSFFKIITYSLIPISLFISLFSYTVINFWLGDKSISANISPSLPWIVLGSLSNSMMIIPLSFLIAKHMTKYLVVQAGILAIISIPILYFLVHQYDLEGASIFWFVINFIPCICLHIYFNLQFKHEFSMNYFGVILTPIIVSIIFISICYFILNFKFLPIQYDIITFGFFLFMSYIFIFIYELKNNRKVTNT